MILSPDAVRGGVALEEQSETKTEKQPVISGKVLWAALGACAVWLAAVGVMLNEADTAAFAAEYAGLYLYA